MYFICFLFSFTSWTHEVLSSATGDFMDHFRLLGAVEALAAIFKVPFSFSPRLIHLVVVFFFFFFG